MAKVRFESKILYPISVLVYGEDVILENDALEATTCESISPIHVIFEEASEAQWENYEG